MIGLRQQSGLVRARSLNQINGADLEQASVSNLRSLELDFLMKSMEQAQNKPATTIWDRRAGFLEKINEHT
mgnify:CR=1 FL=1